ncbi:MAG: DUF1559 domain-containing protein [Thermoguttaceae bacterium]|nr:DUF1559 domain-containing protein [Thermoguttaceae bacterium]
MDPERRIARRRRAILWIFGLLVGFCVLVVLLTIPGFVLSMRENARRERCDINLALIYQGFVEYCDANGTFPPAFTTDSNGAKLHSWRVLLLPYIGEEELYSQIRLDEPWDSEWNRQFWTKTPNVYRCASTPVSEGDPSASERLCAYSAVLGPNSALPEDGRAVSPKEIVDGGAGAILLVERKTPVNWTDPNSEITMDSALQENEKPVRERENFGSWHGRGETVLFCDGSRRFLSEKIDNSVLKLLFGIDDSASAGALESAESEEESEDGALPDQVVPAVGESGAESGD